MEAGTGKTFSFSYKKTMTAPAPPPRTSVSSFLPRPQMSMCRPVAVQEKQNRKQGIVYASSSNSGTNHIAEMATQFLEENVRNCIKPRIFPAEVSSQPERRVPTPFVFASRDMFLRRHVERRSGTGTVRMTVAASVNATCSDYYYCRPPSSSTEILRGVGPGATGSQGIYSGSSPREYANDLRVDKPYQNLLGAPGSSKKKPLEFTAEACLVMVKNPKSGEYVRGKLYYPLRRRPYIDDMDVHLVDSGERATVSVKEIYGLPKMFAQLPCLAIAVHIRDVGSLYRRYCYALEAHGLSYDAAILRMKIHSLEALERFGTLGSKRAYLSQLTKFSDIALMGNLHVEVDGEGLTNFVDYLIREIKRDYPEFTYPR